MIGKATVGQHKNVQKGDTLESEQKWTLEASIKATKNSPSAESLRFVMEGLRESAYSSNVNTSKQEASKFVRALQSNA